MNSQYELRSEAVKIANQAKEILNAVAKDATDEARSHAETTFDRMMADADALEARAARMDRADAFDKALDSADARRPSEERKVETGTAEERAANAFNAYLKGTATAEQRAELRAQSVGTASEGGYLVPTLKGPEIIKSLAAFGPMLDSSLVRIINTGTGANVDHPTFDNTANKAVRINENAQASDENHAFGSKPLNVYKYKSGVIKVSGELMRDSIFDVSSVIYEAISEAFGRGLNEAMTIGDGTGDPTGIAVAASAGVTAAATTAFTSDELHDLVASVNRAYRARAAFQFNDATHTVIRKMKDAEGRYIWQPGLQQGDPNTLLGYRYEINPDMPSVAAGAKAILFGDHNRYAVRLVGGIEVKRLVERYADYDQVGFVAFWRAGGNLLDTGAVKALALKAS